MSEQKLHTQDPRRERMLGTLLRSLDARRRRRRAARGLALVALVVLGVQLIRPGLPGSASRVPLMGGGGNGAPGEPRLVEFVATHDAAANTFVHDEPTTLTQYIDDEQLLASLNEKSDCYGLLRRGTHVALLDRCAP